MLEHVVVHLFLTGVGEDDIGAEVLRRVSREGFHDGLLLAAEGAAHQGLHYPDLGMSRKSPRVLRMPKEVWQPVHTVSFLLPLS